MTANHVAALDDQTVVAIGGSAGIGLETARCAGASGANLILVARDPERRSPEQHMTSMAASNS